MVLTITLNPLLEKRYEVENFNKGELTKSNKTYFTAGGKGINVSRQLNNLGIKNQALTFLGGNTGKILRSVLTDEKINFVVSSTRSNTRESVLILDKKNRNVTTLMESSPILSKQDALELKSKLKKMIQNVTIVVLSGSSPSEYADSIFPYAIELANQNDKIVILDTYGKHLKSCFEKKPMITHQNVFEIESSFNIKINSEKDKINYLKSLYDSGIKISFLTDGANPAYVCKFGFIYKIVPPKINAVDSTGCGDAFIAGVAYGLEKSMVFEDILEFSTQLSVANALSFETCNVDINSANSIKDFKIEEIGNKMKLIDDSPNY